MTTKEEIMVFKCRKCDKWILSADDECFCSNKMDYELGKPFMPKGSEARAIFEELEKEGFIDIMCLEDFEYQELKQKWCRK